MIWTNVIWTNAASLGRLAIASIWIYQGLWCKVLGRMPRHGAVVQAVPLFSPASARVFLLSLGLFETALGIWVLSGQVSTVAACTQIGLLLVMNTGGLLWASRIIPDPPGMVFQNAALAVLIWMCR